MRITINYQTETLTYSLSSNIFPSFVLRRTSPAVTDLMVGKLPILDMDVSWNLSIRAILGQGTVVLTGDVYLSQNDVIALFYEADGMDLQLNLTSVLWSMFSLN